MLRPRALESPDELVPVLDVEPVRLDHSKEESVIGGSGSKGSLTADNLYKVNSCQLDLIAGILWARRLKWFTVKLCNVHFTVHTEQMNALLELV